MNLLTLRDPFIRCRETDFLYCADHVRSANVGLTIDEA
jgi:hypothetical protein